VIALFAAIFLTLKVPFIITIDGNVINIRHEELSKNNGGIYYRHECPDPNCDNVSELEIHIIGDVVNLKDLNNL